MKIDIKTIQTKLINFLLKLRQYVVFIFFITLLLVYSLLVFRINQLNNKAPDEDAIAAKLKTVQRPKIDQSVIDKIKQLQDNSSNVQTLFNNARENPFQE